MPILGNVIPPSNALTPTTVTATGKVTAGAKLDMNGTEIILDADADTSITADTDDQIDIRIAGADDFRFTANTFSVLSGSTLNVDSGATIANSGTATGFGPSVAAASGIMEANANFVDAVIFGPAMDPVDWSGRTAASTASLMLATLEETGGSSQLNIWDLTSTTIAGATPLYTVAIGQVATSITALMGYVMVGTEGAPFFYAPHDNDAWGELTTGWPRRIHSTTVPALTNNNVRAVASGFSDQPAHDPRTGGPMPTFAVGYGTGADIGSVLKDDGNVYDQAGTVGSVGVAISQGSGFFSDQNAERTRSTGPLSRITADDWSTGENITRNDSYPYTFDAENALSIIGSQYAAANASGLGFALFNDLAGVSAPSKNHLTAKINRTYNTGYMVGDIRGAWLANSPTVDRSYKANTLTNNGSAVTAAAVASGAELVGYSGFTADNNLTRASDADWDVLGTGSFSFAGWVNTSSSSGTKALIGFGASDNATEAIVYISGGVLKFLVDGAAGTIGAIDGAAISTGAWHQFVCVQVSSTERHIYQDGVLTVSSTVDTGSVSNSGNMPLAIGTWPDAAEYHATTEQLALMRLSATAPTATQVRQMYDAEKGMFVANAKCLLQSGSTDAVLDVSVDPITSKVAVTQTDSQMIWNGLVMESAPAVNAGASEHNKLYGGDRVEINSVNLYATIAAKSLRGDLELVRGMKAGLPQGVDLSKAKAWLVQTATGSTAAIGASFNIKSVTRTATGLYDVLFAVPFKDANWCGQAGNTSEVGYQGGIYAASNTTGKARINMTDDAATAANTDSSFMFVAFGELENE